VFYRVNMAFEIFFIKRMKVTTFTIKMLRRFSRGVFEITLNHIHTHRFFSLNLFFEKKINVSSQNENYFFGSLTIVFFMVTTKEKSQDFFRKVKNGHKKCPKMKSQKYFWENVLVFLDR